jgi:hypothetical protein
VVWSVHLVQNHFSLRVPLDLSTLQSLTYHRAVRLGHLFSVTLTKTSSTYSLSKSTSCLACSIRMPPSRSNPTLCSSKRLMQKLHDLHYSVIWRLLYRELAIAAISLRWWTCCLVHIEISKSVLTHTEGHYSALFEKWSVGHHTEARSNISWRGIFVSFRPVISLERASEA